ncbi:MAG: hypothetical protein ACSHXA_11405 [Polaribacter sp.]|jgi:hypothetical protein|uniref:hypothetical protein n=1 Tax=Polaribacter sp. TaxID=1920175 RepID=UPI003EFAAB94
MENRLIYYNEKLWNLINKLFIDSGDARCKFINYEENFKTAYFASQTESNPKEVREYWQKMWSDLNSKEAYYNGHTMIKSSFFQTILSKRNKSLEKYLGFLLEEHIRLSNID